MRKFIYSFMPAQDYIGLYVEEDGSITAEVKKHGYRKAVQNASDGLLWKAYKGSKSGAIGTDDSPRPRRDNQQKVCRYLSLQSLPRALCT